MALAGGAGSPARTEPLRGGARGAADGKMAALGSPARTFRGLLRELRHMNAATGRPYRDTAAYRYLVKAFRAHRVRQPVPPGREGARRALGGRAGPALRQSPWAATSARGLGAGGGGAVSEDPIGCPVRVSRGASGQRNGGHGKAERCTWRGVTSRRTCPTPPGPAPSEAVFEAEKKRR